MKAGIQYTEEKFSVYCGNILILLTDGIIEALKIAMEKCLQIQDVWRIPPLNSHRSNLLKQ